MKALSVQQPWAAWIADGRKRFESRRWTTDYRGPLLICSSKKYDAECIHKVTQRAAVFFGEKIKPMPRGVSICVVDLIDCRRMRLGDEDGACCFYLPELFVWELVNPRIVENVPVNGRLGLFDVEVPIEIP